MTEENNTLIFESSNRDLYDVPLKLKFSCVHINIRRLRQQFNLFIASLAKLNYAVDFIIEQKFGSSN